MKTILEYVAQTRTLVAKGECTTHPGNDPVDCGPCRGEHLAGGGGSEAEWRILHAMAACDRLFPRRYRDAEVDHPDVEGWIEGLPARLEGGQSLALLGNVGSGKTHQAYGALRALLVAVPQASWMCASFADFVAALRPKAGVDSEAELSRFRDCDLLLLDDLGTAKSSEWVEEVTYRLVNGRYESMRPTIYTTNLPIGELRKVVGDRIASRLAETCVRVIITGEDRRRQHPEAA